MPSKQSPRRMLEYVNGSVDWSAVRKTVLDAAVAAGFETNSRNCTPPLVPRPRVPNVADALASRIADRVVDTIAPVDEEPVEPAAPAVAAQPARASIVIPPAPPEPQDLGRAAARLAFLSLGTIVGL